MTKITLDDKEYDTVNLTDEQNQIINILNIGTNSAALLDHITQCVRTIQQIKTNELKKSLEDDSQKELDL